ncbi:NUDIX domain-containing protein, partial [Hansschlegelia beijingensis]
SDKSPTVIAIVGYENPSTLALVLESGALAVVERGLLVLIRQFRVPAALATGKGDLVEIVAGRVEPGESAEAAVVREIEEEAGIPAGKIVRLFDFLPTPGIVDESATLFLVSVDAASLPDLSGAAAENELTRPFAATMDEAIESLSDPAPRNAYLLLALQWLALNRGQLRRLLAA